MTNSCRFAPRQSPGSMAVPIPDPLDETWIRVSVDIKPAAMASLLEASSESGRSVVQLLADVLGEADEEPQAASERRKREAR